MSALAALQAAFPTRRPTFAEMEWLDNSDDAFERGWNACLAAIAFAMRHAQFVAEKRAFPEAPDAWRLEVPSAGADQ